MRVTTAEFIKNYLDRFPFLAPAHQGLLQGHGGINVPTVPDIPIP